MPEERSEEHTDAGAASTERERAIAALATDAYWELDERLRYRFHEGRSPILGPEAGSVIGLDRVALIERTLMLDAESIEHNRQMRAHREVDLLLPVLRPGEERRVVRVVAVPRVDEDGRFAGYLGYERDITGFVALRERIAAIALRDELTGLCNRHEFRNRIETARRRVVEEGSEHMLCLLDLDRFKLVNDTAGHALGDRLLRELAALMEAAIEPQETLARLGGDEFALVLDGGVERSTARMEALVQAIAAHEIVHDGRALGVGASIGVASIGAGEVQHVIDLADGACYAAKRAGRNRCVVFTVDSHAYRRHRRELAHVDAIKAALRDERFRLGLQPIERTCPGVSEPRWRETCVRLETGDGSSLAPDVFLPVAERFGLMAELDLWTLGRTLEVLDVPDEAGYGYGCLSVDLSANTLGDDALLERILHLVREREIRPGTLCIELAESAVVANVATATVFMRELEALGVRLALDRFGVGLSALAHLVHLPVDVIKLDRRLWGPARDEPDARAVLAAVVSLAAGLGIDTVAIGVEDATARACLARIGVGFVQGSGVGGVLDIERRWAASVPLRAAGG